MDPEILSPVQQRFDGLIFNRSPKKNYYTCSRRINGKRLMLHRYVWSYHNGPIPDGYHIHHIDHDLDNNRLENLGLTTASEHLRHHSRENQANPVFREKQRKALDRARAYASRWHGSDAAKPFHQYLGKRVWEVHGKQDVDVQCEQCLKPFKISRILKTRQRFCSNNCKSQYRRIQGFDNETRTCSFCQCSYQVNRYKPSEYCGHSCAGKGRWVKRRQKQKP